MTKEQWIREACSDYFEGFPCVYPDCTCDPRNKARWEQEYAEHCAADKAEFAPDPEQSGT